MLAKSCLMFFIGFSSGLPFLMTLTILDVWMKSSNISNTVIGLVTFINIPFIFKFLWAPFVDKMNCPFFPRKFGAKKGWVISSQLMIAFGLMLMSLFSPDKNFHYLILSSILVVFATSIQNIALYSFQINKAKKNEYGPIASFVTFGSRIGMLIANSGSLFIASHFSWKIAYETIAFLVLMSTIAFFFIDEPESLNESDKNKITKISNFLFKSNLRDRKIKKIRAVFFECLVYPFKVFSRSKNWIIILFLIAIFKAGDVFAHKMSKPLYLELGFSTEDIALVVGIFGVFATIVGGLIGGKIVQNLGVHKSMLICGIVHAFANLLYLSLYLSGHNYILFHLSVAIENLSGGMMMTAFLSFIYGISMKWCYPSTIYALLWGIHGLGSNLFRSISGYVVDTFGWTSFYIASFFISFPGIICVLILLSYESKHEIKESDFEKAA